MVLPSRKAWLCLVLIYFPASFNIGMCYSVVKRFPVAELNLEDGKNEINIPEVTKPEDAFLGVYSECILYLSFTCIQKKTLRYLHEVNRQDEIPILGSYLKFVKIKDNYKSSMAHNAKADVNKMSDSSQPLTLSEMIDGKVETFFTDHVLRVRYGNRSKEDIDIGRMLDTAEGRKKQKGDGGGGGDGGKKKMMMMAMMMMKMKLMMMVPAMMGMMGMISFKALIFSIISLLISKVLLLMKLMGSGGGKMGAGGGSHGGGDAPVWMPGGGGGGGGWNVGGGSGGDAYGGGGGGGSSGGGGYNANGDWQSRAGWEVLRGAGVHQARGIGSSGDTLQPSEQQEVKQSPESEQDHQKLQEDQQEIRNKRETLLEDGIKSRDEVFIRKLNNKDRLFSRLEDEEAVKMTNRDQADTDDERRKIFKHRRTTNGKLYDDTNVHNYEENERNRKSIVANKIGDSVQFLGEGSIQSTLGKMNQINQKSDSISNIPLNDHIEKRIIKEGNKSNNALLNNEFQQALKLHQREKREIKKGKDNIPEKLYWKTVHQQKPSKSYVASEYDVKRLSKNTWPNNILNRNIFLPYRRPLTPNRIISEEKPDKVNKGFNELHNHQKFTQAEVSQTSPTNQLRIQEEAMNNKQENTEEYDPKTQFKRSSRKIKRSPEQNNKINKSVGRKLDYVYDEQDGLHGDKFLDQLNNILDSEHVNDDKFTNNLEDTFYPTEYYSPVSTPPSEINMKVREQPKRVKQKSTNRQERKNKKGKGKKGNSQDDSEDETETIGSYFKGMTEVLEENQWD